MLKKIMLWWREFVKRRKNADAISPRTIRNMANELEHLAELTSYSQLLSGREARHLHSLREVVRNLKQMVDEPQFCRLSADRRLALHHSLQNSRQKLLDSIQAAESPTERIQ